MINTAVNASLGAFQKNPIVDGSAVLGTAATKVALENPGDSTQNRYHKVRINNLSTTALVTWMTVNRGAAAPTIAAATPGSTMGDPVFPRSSVFIIIRADKDLYVAADGASTSWSCTSCLQS